MNNKPFFSIITVCFNSATTIERTIKSILNQNFSDYEYIIVDGGSSDATIDIIKEYEPLFQGRLKWKSESDKGIYDAMNKGILRSEGIIIGIVNSDDWLEPDTLQTVWEENRYCEHSNRTIIAGEILFHYSSGSTQLYPTSPRIYESKSRNFEMGLNHPATFVPRFVYDTIGLFDVNFKLKADADFILRCYENRVPVHFIPKVLSNMSDGGASNNRSKKELTDTVLKYKKHIKSKPLYYIYCIKSYVNWYVKGLVPMCFVRYYRNVHNRKK